MQDLNYGGLIGLANLSGLGISELNFEISLFRIVPYSRYLHPKKAHKS